MSLLINLAIAGILIYSAWAGTRRGLVLVGLELLSFGVATVLAIALYHPVGDVIKALAHVSSSLANIVAFALVWVVTEIGSALAIRFGVLPRLGPHMHLSNLNRLGGGGLNLLKSAAIVTLGLIIFASLPLSPGIKRPILEAFIPQQLIAASGGPTSRLAVGLGRDFTDSLSFFTVTAAPESEQRIELGFNTTNVSVAPRDEDAMLVLLNHERTSRDLPALSLNIKARAVARSYSAAMFAGGFFSHVDLAGKTPFDRMKAGGVMYGSAGENLALAPTMLQAHQGLMKSPGHKANILNPAYRTVGIGIVDGGPYGEMVTQNFTD